MDRTNSLKSPSSPDLRDRVSRISITRSASRPLVPPQGSVEKWTKRRDSELSVEQLTVDTDSEWLKKIRQWILGLIVVDFDLDLGPVVRNVYPPLGLSPSESENIAFASFPDSLQFDQGSQVHSFRIREGTASSENLKQEDLNGRPLSRDGFICGYSHFTQKKDPTSKRGYQQRSIVILTCHQYPALFTTLSSIIGPLYQSHGLPILEAACLNISNWSSPTPGTTIELGFLGSVLPVELPLTVDEQQLTDTSSFGEKYNSKLHILASSSPLSPPPLALFEASLSHLWSIWECLVLCEPILVFGHSPAMTSQAIWWFRDLIRPIPLAHDIRPYFTIHDKDYSVLVNKLPPKAGVILGVTNPFFEASCKHWPNALTLGQQSRVTPATVGPPPGWKAKTHKRFTSKDRDILKQLEDACRNGSERARIEASLVLRRHFCSRTTAFLVPLNRYLNSLIPPPAEYTSSNGTPRLKTFNSTNFFTSLKTHGSSLPFRSKGKQREFYERWLKTPGFGLWLGHQEEIVQRVLIENCCNK